MQRPFSPRHFLALAVFLAAGYSIAGQEMEYYDPAAQPNKTPSPTSEVVTVTIEPNKPLLTIPKYFYGLNIHPGSAKYEFARIDLLKALKPDSIRIMTRMRSDWPPNGQGRQVTHLSPERGVMDWRELDLIIDDIIAIGAVPYLALGFGPPHWMTNAQNPMERQPPKQEYIDEYADFMAEIVKRYVKEKKLPIDSVTVENEPENVHYAIEDYAKLFRLAKIKIQNVAPNIRVGGPTIGYAKWVQPDGSSLGFSTSLNKLKSQGANFDFIDWHIYSTSSQTVLDTVKAVRQTYGKDTPLIISELNRDWRYSGPMVAQSRENNTNQGSVAWLATLYDELQLAGVERTYYFAWRENNLGLVDAQSNMRRPNYYLFMAMTNHLGRKRVKATVSNPAIGCIATNDNGETRAILYNKTDKEIKITTNYELSLYPANQEQEPTTPKTTRQLSIKPLSFILLKQTK